MYRLKETQMIKIQKISKAFILLVAVAGIISCNEDNVEPFEGIGDVYTTKRIIHDEPQYAQSYFAYGTQPMSMAKVSTPDGDEIQLTATDAIENTWAKSADLFDYSPDFPMEGDYLFTVLHEDVPHEFSDKVTFIDLDFSEITLTEMIDGVLTVEWSAGPDSQGHSIRLLSPTGDLVFISSFVLEQNTKLVIGENMGAENWADGYPNVGEDYTLEIHSFAFESTAANQDRIDLHIEEIAISEETVTWE